MRIICEQAWELKACTQPKALPISEWEYEVINKYARNETKRQIYETDDTMWFGFDKKIQIRQLDVKK